jgi:hypothetical protein
MADNAKKIVAIIDSGVGTVENSLEQFFHAAHLDVIPNVVDAGLGEIARAMGDKKGAEIAEAMVALRHTDVNRAHFYEEFDKMVHHAPHGAADAEPKPLTTPQVPKPAKNLSITKI